MVYWAPPIDLWWRACDHYSRCLKGCCPKPISISTCTLCRICTLYSTKNDACLRKPFCCCSAFPLQAHLLRHKRSSGRHECNPGRSVSEAAPRFRNLCVYEPSTLWKKPSASLEKTFDSRKKPSDLWGELCCKRISEKHSECWHHFF